VTGETTDLAAHVAAALLPFRAGGLISPQCRQRILDAAALLPAAASGFFGLEARLGESIPEVDFLACVSAAAGGREAWAAAIPPAGMESLPAWRRAARFVRTWAEPGSPFHDPITNMWVEFDLVAGSPSPLLPSLFFGTDALGPEQGTPDQHRWLVAAIEELADAPLPGARRNQAADCLMALPPGGRLFQIGVMLSRTQPFLRLCVKGIPIMDIPGYLEGIGWRGARCELDALLAAIAPLIDDVMLDLDLEDGIRERIGLECYLDEGPQLSGRLTALLAHLQSVGLCTQAKAGALVAWYGLTHERWCRGSWPADLRDDPQRPGPGHSGGFVRSLHHIKLVFDPPRALEAKAYLASRFAWIDDAALKRALAEQPRET
jgi:hypothetical protein